MTLLETELLASSPNRVYSWFENDAADDNEDTSTDAELESALLHRREPLVDLAIARFSMHQESLVELFWRPTEKSHSGVRLAILSNTRAGKRFVRLPSLLKGIGPLDDHTAANTEILATLSEAEVVTLFRNPNLDDRFLTAFLEQGDPWKTLDRGDHLMLAVYSLGDNRRMEAEYDGGMDGWAEYSHSKVFSAAWKLAGNAPVSDDWAIAMSRLLARTRAEAFDVDKPLEMARRWSSNVADTNLGPHAQVRKQLARLALRKEPHLVIQLLLDEDFAMRAAAYQHAALTPEQIRAGAARDGSDGFCELVENADIWKSRVKREALNEIAWNSAHSDRASLTDANIYDAVAERMAREHPDWFKEESDEDDLLSDLVAASPTKHSKRGGGHRRRYKKNELSTAASNSLRQQELHKIVESIGVLAAAIQQLNRRSALISWGIAAILVVALFLKN